MSACAIAAYARCTNSRFSCAPIAPAPSVRILTMRSDQGGVKQSAASNATPPAPKPLVRVPLSFTEEYPDGSLLATETFINIGLLTGGVRSAVEALLRRHGVTSFGAFNV